MANTNTGKGIVSGLEDVNEIISKLLPIIPNVMGIIGLFLKSPDVRPEVRRQAIETMRSNFTKIDVEARAWLAENGYDEDGNKLP